MDALGGGSPGKFRALGLVAPLLAAIGLTAIFEVPAQAERAQSGNLIVSLNGGIRPRKLPRSRPAPVAVHLSGRALTADRSPLPRVNWIRLELAWRGVMDTRGLPTCPRQRLRGTSSRQAVASCGGALVGRGRLFARVFVPNQTPFAVNAQLNAFNGRTAAGHHALLVHAFSLDPPVSFTIPFTVRRRPGNHTVLVALIRRSAGPWPHVTSFQVSVSRRFLYRGKWHSYLSASCPVPHGFTAGFSYARATYTFAGEDQLSTESVRSCRAR